MISYEYKLFLQEKIREYLPSTFVRIGGKYNGKCPFCGDSHKSATKKRGWWYADKDCSYYCFNCGIGMSGIKLLQALSGKDYDELKREYVRLFLKSGLTNGLSSEYEPPKEEPGIFELKPVVKPEWKKPLSDAAKTYLAGRMVDRAPFLKDELFSCRCRNDSEYILIPWTLNGVEAYYQLNDFQKHGPIKYVFPKDSKKLVFGLDNVDVTWPYLIVFEGVYDSLFVKNGIAVGTKSVTEYQLKLMRERYPNHRICISFDNDKPGVTAMAKVISKGGDALFFRWFNKNTEQKDINDYVLAKNDPNIFADQTKLERMMATPLQMKLWLIQNGMWPADLLKKQVRPTVNKTYGTHSGQKQARKVQ